MKTRFVPVMLAVALVNSSSASAGEALPPVKTVAIGPFADILSVALSSIDTRASALDASTKYAHVADQAYLIQGIGELLWAARDHPSAKRDHLVDTALGELQQVRAAAYQTDLAPKPAFGRGEVKGAACGDDDNPKNTAYTWQSGMVALAVAKLARALHHIEHPQAGEIRDFGVDLVNAWGRYFENVQPDSGVWYYSTRRGDAVGIHNTNVLMGMASQILSELGGPAGFSDRAKRSAAFLRSHLGGDARTGFIWNYGDKTRFGCSRIRHVEDVSHAHLDLQMMRFAFDRGWWTEADMRGASRTLVGTRRMWRTLNPARLAGYVNSHRHDAKPGSQSLEYTWTRAAAIGYAAHGDSPGGDPMVFELARSIAFSSMLSRGAFPSPALRGSDILALAFLVTRRPAVFESGSRWEMVAGDLQDGTPPSQPGGAHFGSGWKAATDVTAGFPLKGRVATAPNAEIFVDLEDATVGRVLVSVTYLAPNNTVLSEDLGPSNRREFVALLPVTRDCIAELNADDCMERAVEDHWHRTTFELERRGRTDSLPDAPGTNVRLRLSKKGVTIHRIEVTPLD